MVKYTRDCLLPWKYMLIHAGGLMQTCPCASDVEIGDFLLDYIEKKDEEPDIFNRKSLQMVREGLLTGNLRKMCQNCAFRKDELITTDELKEKVICELEKIRTDYKYAEDDDLTREYAYKMVGVGFSNRCNLRCLYCNQSTCAETNPFYRAEFSYESAEETLEYLVNRGVTHIASSVEGEITIYKHWYELYSSFLQKYPDINLKITTNLNREYSEEEIELLARHEILDISCDSLDPQIYSSIRVNGKLPLLLSNLEKIKKKIKELNIPGPVITIHVVVCNLTWESLEEVSEYAFKNGFGLNIGNYEERVNAKGYQEGILKPISKMPEEIQQKVAEILNRIKARAVELKLDEKHFVCHGDIIARVNKLVDKRYHRFVPLDNELYQQFYEKDKKGTENVHLDIVYDDNNIAYTGIRLRKEDTVCFENLNTVKRVIVREVATYKDGKKSPKFEQKVAPGYRKVYEVKDNRLELTVKFQSEDIESVLVECEPLYS